MKQLHIIFNKSELRKPRCTLASLTLLTVEEFRRNSLIVFISYNVISHSCANGISFWIGLKNGWRSLLSSISAVPVRARRLHWRDQVPSLRVAVKNQ